MKVSKVPCQRTNTNPVPRFNILLLFFHGQGSASSIAGREAEQMAHIAYSAQGRHSSGDGHHLTATDDLRCPERPPRPCSHLGAQKQPSQRTPVSAILLLPLHFPWQQHQPPRNQLPQQKAVKYHCPCTSAGDGVLPWRDARTAATRSTPTMTVFLGKS